MEENIRQVVRESQSTHLEGPELEEKEFLLIQELCGNEDTYEIFEIAQALGASGTILSIPVLLGHLKGADAAVEPILIVAIKMIKTKAKERRSILPDEFYTLEHWQPEWVGSKNAFLTYVQVIADAYIQFGMTKMR
jgi:hypothetical protein